MTLVFWCAVVLIGYAYFGYPAWIWLRSRIRPRPVRIGPYTASISVILVVRNEGLVVERKLRNLLSLNYPVDRTEIIVLSDGSTDATNSILSAFAGPPRLMSIMKEHAAGKAAGLNDAMRIATGEIVIFTDARQYVEPDAIRFLAENFADAQVGCVCGQLMLGDPESGETNRGLGSYWKVEKKIRQMESAAGSTIGATGALYAVRRSLFVPLPPETILDDVFTPMQVLRQRKRVVFEPRARAWDLPYQGHRREFVRKVRTLSGNYQLFQLAPWLLGSSNPAWFAFFSHKVSRLLVPLALVAMLLSSAVLPGKMYHALFALQLLFYGFSLVALAGLKQGLVGKVADASFNLLLLNTAALFALAKFVLGRRTAWA
ncbi:MAG TPA: glycosyltransferase family 2 protein [Verrucomicrobiae bacterium]|nr:glycosyltransferase family 2 protein [Verrucomicrobiae bacterium]